MAIIELFARLYLVYRGTKALMKIIAAKIRRRRAKQPPTQTPGVPTRSGEPEASGCNESNG